MPIVLFLVVFFVDFGGFLPLFVCLIFCFEKTRDSVFIFFIKFWGSLTLSRKIKKTVFDLCFLFITALKLMDDWFYGKKV